MVDNITYDSDGFPSHLIPKSKKDKEWVKAWGRAIEIHWNRNRGDTTTIMDDQMDIPEMRRYAAGKQDTAKYFQWFELAKGDSGDTQIGMNFINEPIPVGVKYKILATDSILERDYTPVIDALDPDSVAAKEKFKFENLAKIYSEKYYAEYAAAAGLEQIQDPDQPQTPEELEVYMETGGYKNAVCMAMEKLLIQDLRANKWDYRVKEQIAEDLIVTGMGAAIDVVLPGGKLVVEAVRFEDLVLPDIPDGPPDSKEMPYIGRLRMYTLEELERRAGDQFTEIQYKTIKESHFGYVSNGGWTHRPYNAEAKNPKMFCQVLEFYFRSVDVTKYKVSKTKGGEVYKKRSSDWEPKGENGRVGKYENNHDQIYQGCLIVGSNFCFDTGIMKYTARQVGDSAVTTLPIHVFTESYYLIRGRSVMSMMIPFIDMYHFAWFNLQNMMASVVPPGVIAEMDSIQSTGTGRGGSINEVDYIKAAKQTGNMLYQRLNEYGHQNEIPVQFHDGFFPKTVQPLIEVMMAMVSVMENIIGFNSATNASTQSSEALVGIAQTQMFGTQKALSGLFRAYSRGCESLYWSMMGRIQGIIQDDKGGYKKKVGEFSTLLTKSMDQISMASLGVSVQVGMTEREKMQMEADIEKSLAKREATGVGGIELEDAIAIRRLPTQKMQEAMLLARRRRRAREDDERTQANRDHGMAEIEAAGKNQTRLLEMKMQGEMAKQQTVMQQKIDADRETQMRDIETKLKTTQEDNMAKITVAIKNGLALIESAQITGEAKVESTKIQGEDMKEKQEIANKKPVSSGNK